MTTMPMLLLLLLMMMMADSRRREPETQGYVLKRSRNSCLEPGQAFCRKTNTHYTRRLFRDEAY